MTAFLRRHRSGPAIFAGDRIEIHQEPETSQITQNSGRSDVEGFRRRIRGLFAEKLIPVSQATEEARVVQSMNSGIAEVRPVSRARTF